MLGSVDQDIIQELSPDLWSIMMFYIAKFMYPLYKKIQPVLIEKNLTLTISHKPADLVHAQLHVCYM
jgi:hypothetical protein